MFASTAVPRMICLTALAALAWPAVLPAQTDSVQIKTYDGAAQQPRLVVTTSTAGQHASIRVENGLLRLSSTAPLGTAAAGDLRWDSGATEVRYYDGAAWQAVASKTYGSSNYLARNAADTSSASFAGFLYNLSNTNGTSGSGALRGSLSGGSFSNGTHYGLYGESNRSDDSLDAAALYNLGVTGRASGASSVAGTTTRNYGLYGYSAGTGTDGTTLNFAVYGEAVGGGSSNNYGVYGYATGATTGTNYGVYGRAVNGGTNWAGYFFGTVYVTGTEAQQLWVTTSGSGGGQAIYASNSGAGGSVVRHGVYSGCTGGGASTTNIGIEGAASGATTNWGGRFVVTGGGTSTVLDTVVLDRQPTGGFAAAGIGTALLFRTSDDFGVIEQAARISGLLTTVTDGSEASALTFQTRSAGGALTERMRIQATGELVPGADDLYDLGTSTLRWRNLYLTGSLTAENSSGCEFVAAEFLNFNLTAAVENLASISLTLGAPGYVIVYFDGALVWQSLGSTVALGIGDDAVTMDRDVLLVGPTNGGAVEDESFSLSWVYQIAAAGTYTFYALGSSTSDTKEDVRDCFLHAIYVPIRY
ncbi:MAG: hypothetical protein HY720_05215 [Planctomycetes bacterium]|nr:hypothetical protein [Planctomycetota bacterium]